MASRVNLVSSLSVISKPTPDLVRNVAQELIRGVFMSSELRARIIFDMRNCSDMVLERCHESLSNSELSFSGKNTYRSKIRSLFSGDEEVTEHELNEALFFYPVLNAVDGATSRKLVAALHDCHKLPYADDYTRAGDEVRAKCLALLKVLGETFNPFDLSPYRESANGFVFKDEALTELVLEFPDRVDMIIGVIRTRKSFDAELIRGVTAGSATALGSGTL